MKNDSPATQRRQDSQTLLHTLYKLNATATILSVVLVIVVAIIWWDLLNRLISFGANLDYSGLEALSVKNLAMLKQYNPFFWWTIVAVISLLIIHVLYQVVRGIYQRSLERTVDESTIAKLSQDLSPEAKSVLLWVWEEKMHPVTVGVLQRTLQEIRGDRYAKMQLAQQHEALLTMPPSTPEHEN